MKKYIITLKTEDYVELEISAKDKVQALKKAEKIRKDEYCDCQIDTIEEVKK